MAMRYSGKAYLLVTSLFRKQILLHRFPFLFRFFPFAFLQLLLFFSRWTLCIDIQVCPLLPFKNGNPMHHELAVEVGNCLSEGT
jgi:hypothetical protein